MRLCFRKHPTRQLRYKLIGFSWFLWFILFTIDGLPLQSSESSRRSRLPYLSSAAAPRAVLWGTFAPNQRPTTTTTTEWFGRAEVLESRHATDGTPENLRRRTVVEGTLTRIGIPWICGVSVQGKRLQTSSDSSVKWVFDWSSCTAKSHVLPPEVGILQLVSVQGSGDVDVFSTDAHHFPLQLCKLDSTRYIYWVLSWFHSQEVSRHAENFPSFESFWIIPSSIQYFKTLSHPKNAGKAALLNLFFFGVYIWTRFLQTCLLPLILVEMGSDIHGCPGDPMLTIQQLLCQDRGQTLKLRLEGGGAKFVQVNTTCCPCGHW